MTTAIVTVLLFFVSFSQCSQKKQQTGLQDIRDTVRTMTDAEANKNKKTVIYGKLQKYTPWTQGKGANHMFWDWEIKLEGGGKIPVVSADKSDGESIIFAEYENENVIIFGTVYYGIVIGNPDGQNASGYRIDADGIMVNEGLPLPQHDTCRVWKDIEYHWNSDAFVEGWVQAYEPPHDNSKLGDEKIWTWVLKTADNYTIPLITENKSLDIGDFIGKRVLVNAFIKYGIIFGRENTANIVGTRIEAYDITAVPEPDPLAKITINLNDFNDEGYRKLPDGEMYTTHYEFCIPANDSIFNYVSSVDKTLGVYKTSKGRSGCSDKEWLCIGNSRQAGFKDTIKKLAGLPYIRKISETFWE